MKKLFFIFIIFLLFNNAKIFAGNCDGNCGTISSRCPVGKTTSDCSIPDLGDTSTCDKCAFGYYGDGSNCRICPGMSGNIPPETCNPSNVRTKDQCVNTYASYLCDEPDYFNGASCQNCPIGTKYVGPHVGRVLACRLGSDCDIDDIEQPETHSNGDYYTGAQYLDIPEDVARFCSPCLWDDSLDKAYYQSSEGKTYCKEIPENSTPILSKKIGDNGEEVFVEKHITFACDKGYKYWSEGNDPFDLEDEGCKECGFGYYKKEADVVDVSTTALDTFDRESECEECPLGQYTFTKTSSNPDDCVWVTGLDLKNDISDIIQDMYNDNYTGEDPSACRLEDKPNYFLTEEDCKVNFYKKCVTNLLSQVLEKVTEAENDNDVEILGNAAGSLERRINQIQNLAYKDSDGNSPLHKVLFNDPDAPGGVPGQLGIVTLFNKLLYEASGVDKDDDGNPYGSVPDYLHIEEMCGSLSPLMIEEGSDYTKISSDDLDPGIQLRIMITKSNNEEKSIDYICEEVSDKCQNFKKEEYTEYLSTGLTEFITDKANNVGLCDYIENEISYNVTGIDGEEIEGPQNSGTIKSKIAEQLQDKCIELAKSHDSYCGCKEWNHDSEPPTCNSEYDNPGCISEVTIETDYCLQEPQVGFNSSKIAKITVLNDSSELSLLYDYLEKTDSGEGKHVFINEFVGISNMNNDGIGLFGYCKNKAKNILEQDLRDAYDDFLLNLQKKANLTFPENPDNLTQSFFTEEELVPLETGLNGTSFTFDNNVFYSAGEDDFEESSASEDEEGFKNYKSCPICDDEDGDCKSGLPVAINTEKRIVKMPGPDVDYSLDYIIEGRLKNYTLTECAEDLSEVCVRILPPKTQREFTDETPSYLFKAYDFTKEDYCKTIAGDYDFLTGYNYDFLDGEQVSNNEEEDFSFVGFGLKDLCKAKMNKCQEYLEGDLTKRMSTYVDEYQSFDNWTDCDLFKEEYYNGSFNNNDEVCADSLLGFFDGVYLSKKLLGYGSLEDYLVLKNSYKDSFKTNCKTNKESCSEGLYENRLKSALLNAYNNNMNQITCVNFSKDSCLENYADLCRVTLNQKANDEGYYIEKNDDGDYLFCASDFDVGGSDTNIDSFCTQKENDCEEYTMAIADTTLKDEMNSALQTVFDDCQGGACCDLNCSQELKDECVNLLRNDPVFDQYNFSYSKVLGICNIDRVILGGLNKSIKQLCTIKKNMLGCNDNSDDDDSSSGSGGGDGGDSGSDDEDSGTTPRGGGRGEGNSPPPPNDDDGSGNDDSGSDDNDSESSGGCTGRGCGG